jgi:hypothetical protein
VTMGAGLSGIARRQLLQTGVVHIHTNQLGRVDSDDASTGRHDGRFAIGGRLDAICHAVALAPVVAQPRQTVILSSAVRHRATSPIPGGATPLD